MKKNRRIGFLLIIVLLFTSSILNAEAIMFEKEVFRTTIEIDEEREKNLILTYAEAGQMALKQSYTLKNQQEGLKKIEAQRESAATDLGGVYPSGNGNGAEDSNRLNLLKRLVSIDTSLELAKKEIETTKEKTIFETKALMNELNKLIAEKEITEMKIKIAKSKLDFARIKKDKGLISEYTLQQEEETYKKLINEMEISDKAIETNYIKLNNQLGINNAESYILENNTIYAPVEENNLDTLVSRVSSSNPSLWSQQKKIEMAELDLNLYVYNAGGDSYEVKKIDLLLEKNNLASQKKTLEESIKTTYSQIKQLEKSYELAQANLKSAERSLALVRAQYNAGIAIYMELQEVELQVEQLKNELKSKEMEHEKQAVILYKPYL